MRLRRCECCGVIMFNWFDSNICDCCLEDLKEDIDGEGEVIRE